MQVRRPIVAAVVVGAGAGLAGRHFLELVAGVVTRQLFGTVTTKSCTMERSLECALRDGPSIFGAFLRYAAVLVVVAGVMAVLAAGLLVTGAVRARRRAPTEQGGGPSMPVDPVAVSLLGVGAAMAVPPCWLVGVLLVAWAR